MPNIRIAAACSLALCGTPAAAQTREDEQVWINVTAMGSIKDRLIYFAEVQPRVGDGVSRLEALLLRPAIGYQVTRRLALYMGYAHVEEGPADRDEERLFQQATWTVPGLRSGELQSRTRLEQRWRSDGRDMQWRLRQMVRYEHEIVPRVAALGSAEAFFAFNKPDWRPRSGFDQLRSFAGAEIRLKGRSTIEAGYLNQLIDLPGRAKQVNHVASIALFVRR